MSLMTPSLGLEGQEHAASPRVLYLLRYYPRFSETFIVNEIIELERQGMDLQILSMRRPDDGFFHESVCRVCAVAGYLPETEQKLRRRTLPHLRRLLRSASAASRQEIRALYKQGRITFTDLLGAVYVIRQLKKQSIDHTHVHFGKEASTLAFLANRLTGAPYSMTLHAYDIFRDDVDRDLLARKINASRRVITVSNYNRTFLLDQFSPEDPEKVVVLYNGIDLTRFSDRGQTRESHTILTVGRLIEKKGFVHLIDAVALLRDEGIFVRCQIAGDGKEASRLCERIESQGVSDRIELLGKVRQDEVGRMMSTAGCFVLPCVRATDGNIDALPTVLLEAMACGAPCISTQLSGIPEIIDDQISGLLVKPESPRELADAIKRVLGEGFLGARLGRGARRKVEMYFDVEKNACQLHTLFRQMIGGAAGSRSRPDKRDKRQTPVVHVETKQ